MPRLPLAIVLACAVGCTDSPSPTSEPADIAPVRDELAILLDERLDAAVDGRLTAIETSLEQIQAQLELLREELTTAQIQQDRLTAFEAEIKQALVDLGNVLRRAISLQSSPASNALEPRERRP